MYSPRHIHHRSTVYTHIFGRTEVEEQIIRRGGFDVKNDGVVPALPDVRAVTPQTVAAGRHRYFDLKRQRESHIERDPARGFTKPSSAFLTELACFLAWVISSLIWEMLRLKLSSSFLIGFSFSRSLSASSSKSFTLAPAAWTD